MAALFIFCLQFITNLFGAFGFDVTSDGTVS
jgi:hypothetical protein